MKSFAFKVCFLGWTQPGGRVNPAPCACVCYLSAQENPSEEDAAIVDKILAVRVSKKEVRLFMLCFLYFLFIENW